MRTLLMLLSCTFAAAGEGAIPRQVTVPRTREVLTAPSAVLTLRATADALVATVDIADGTVVAGIGWTPAVQLDQPALAHAVAMAEARCAVARHTRGESALDAEQAARDLAYRQELLEADRRNGLVARLPELRFAADLATLAKRRAELAAEGARLREAEAAVALAAAQADRARLAITAPAGWTVVRCLVRPGQTVRAGEALADLADLRELSVAVEAAEGEVEALRATQAQILTTREGKSVQARLLRIAPVVEAGAKGRVAELRLSADAVRAAMGEAVGGIPLRLTLEVAEPGGGWLVPRALVREVEGRHRVRVAGAERTVRVLNWRGDDAVVARDDLEAGKALVPW